jgi:hypothetical protein
MLASRSPSIQHPHEPFGIAPFRLTLDDEGLAIDDELIVGPRVGDFARPQLEGRGLGMDAGLAEADDGVRTPGDDPNAYRLAARRRVEGIPKAANVASTAPWNTVIRSACP